jgi:hypothetical protein
MDMVYITSNVDLFTHYVICFDTFCSPINAKQDKVEMYPENSAGFHVNCS